MALLWAAWGEREIRFSQEELLAVQRYQATFPSFKVFQQIYRYENGRVVVGKQLENTERDRHRGFDQPWRPRGSKRLLFKLKSGLLVVSEKNISNIYRAQLKTKKTKERP